MKRTGLALGVIALLWLATLLGAPLLGSHSLRFADLFQASPDATILWSLRLPRVLLALAAGGALAATGLGFQTLFRNPLAEPYTLGIASGAALGAVVAIRLGAEEWSAVRAIPAVGFAAFCGAVVTAALVLRLARPRSGFGEGSATLLLAGVAVSLSCQALILLLQYFAEPYQTFRMMRWTIGGLAVVGYSEAVWLAPWTIAGATALFFARWDLNVLLTGEELAASRGVDVPRLRRRAVLVSSAVLGATVAVTGPIGFVGLMVPHVLRRFLGHDHRVLIPAAVLGGGVFLALSDLAARTLLAPLELPVGILTAALGGPFFLALLARRSAR